MNEQPEKYGWDSYGWFVFDWHSPGQKDIATDRGVSRVEAATVFADPTSLTIRDPRLPEDSARFVTVGLSYRGRRLRVSHTDTVEAGAPENRPDTLLLRIDDAQEILPAPENPNTWPGQDEFAHGTPGRYLELYVTGTNVTYIDENERYWFNVPADTFQTCLWWVDLEKVRSDPDQPIVGLTFDITHIRQHHHLPKDLRFILRLEGVTTVRAYHFVEFPSGLWREETMSWPEFEAAVNTAGMYVEDTRLARVEETDTGLFLDMDGLLEVAGKQGRKTEGVTFRIHAGTLRVLRSDGVPCSLEELEKLGDAEWDAREEQALLRKRPLIERIRARFRRGSAS